MDNPIAPKEIRERITREVRRFDIISLLQLLEYIGYEREDILFKSHLSNISAPTLIERIFFRDEPIRQVVIWLNMGLLSVSTPLPSYFLRALEKETVEEESFIDFMGFFDHKLLEGFFGSIYPEQNPISFPNWERSKRGYLHLLTLHSISFLHWMFELTFPELGLLVEQSDQQRDLKGAGILVGAKLGAIGSFGGHSTVPVTGYNITLFSESENTDWELSWAAEIKDRLESTIFPIIRDFDIHIKLFLVIQSQKGWAKLQQETYLGVDRIKGGIEKPRQVLIYKGRVSQD